MRFLHRFYAAVFGYFWLPCPICGRMFGGHECGERSVRVGDHYRIACRRHD